MYTQMYTCIHRTHMYASYTNVKYVCTHTCTHTDICVCTHLHLPEVDDLMRTSSSTFGAIRRPRAKKIVCIHTHTHPHRKIDMGIDMDVGVDTEIDIPARCRPSYQHCQQRLWSRQATTCNEGGFSRNCACVHPSPRGSAVYVCW